MAHIETLVQLKCCNTSIDLDPIERDIDPTSGGMELAKRVCHECGAEYMFGVIARTREQSLADEAFEHVNDEVLDEIGVDRGDFEPPADEVRMCARCDGTAGAEDLCGLCKEYVHVKCRTRTPSRRMHAAEEHWEESKTPMTAMTTATSVEDDGSVLTGDDRLDFVAED